MSLRFFTNTKVGELMSRLNNDVVGAQNAISNTIVSIITNIIQGMAVLIVMLTLEWRLTLVSVIICRCSSWPRASWAGGCAKSRASRWKPTRA
jgi:ABC-type multidrug transport system fused ATPase/permease subunit